MLAHQLLALPQTDSKLRNRLDPQWDMSSMGFVKGSLTNVLGNKRTIGVILLAHVILGLMVVQYFTSTTPTTPVPPTKAGDMALTSFERELGVLIETDNATTENGVAKLFLQSYTNYCEKRSVNQSKEVDLPWCSCVPGTLVGRQNVSSRVPTKPDLSIIQKIHPEVKAGGNWKPIGCKPRQNIAVIIVYRNRTLHLHTFLEYMIPFLQRQLLEFTIFVVEQGKPDIFNKASLMNAGFLEARKLRSFDCYFFHDVDTLPEDDRNPYVCTDNPRHLGRYVDRYKYEIKYNSFVGGGVAFTERQFNRTNGVSNKYYGWGGEDDDIYFRIIVSNQQVTRFPRAVARYTAIDHTPDSGNPTNSKRFKLLASTRQNRKKSSLSKDGLNTIKYTVRQFGRKPLYTWVLVDLPPPPKTYTFGKRKYRPKKNT